MVRDTAPERAPGAGRSRILWQIWEIFPKSRAQVSAALLISLVVSAASHAAENPQAAAPASSEQRERPDWLRPLGDDAIPRLLLALG